MNHTSSPLEEATDATAGPARSTQEVTRAQTNFAGVLYSIVGGRRVLHCMACSCDMYRDGDPKNPREVCPRCGIQVTGVRPA